MEKAINQSQLGSLVEPIYKILQIPCRFLAVPCDSMYALPWNTKSCNSLKEFSDPLNGLQNIAIPCSFLQGECIPAIKPVRSRRFPCKTLYALSTRGALCSLWFQLERYQLPSLHRYLWLLNIKKLCVRTLFCARKVLPHCTCSRQ